jgi:dihydrofolate reductase
MKLIVAFDPKGGIGYNGKLPWSKIEGDLPRFKELTTNKIVLMGRNTYESLPKKPLPNRINWVKSSSPIIGVENPDDDTIIKEKDVWLIGGAKMIESYWEHIDEIHVTRTFTEYTCDTFIDIVKLEKEFMCWFKETFSDHTYEVWKRKLT